MSGYLTTLPANVVLDEGVVYINSTTAFGVTKGPVSYDPGETWQNVAFAGKRSDVALLDRVVERMPKLSFDMIALSSATSPVLFTGSTQVGTPLIVTPHAASTLLVAGDYETNVKVYFKQGNGTFFGIVFAMAFVKCTAINGQDKDAVSFAVTIEARQDLSGSTDTDVSPVKYEVQAASIT